MRPGSALQLVLTWAAPQDIGYGRDQNRARPHIQLEGNVFSPQVLQYRVEISNLIFSR